MLSALSGLSPALNIVCSQDVTCIVNGIRNCHDIYRFHHRIFYRPCVCSSLVKCHIVQGHQDFLEESHMDEKGPWKTCARFPVRAVEYCRIEGLEYIMDHESGKVSCKLVLEFTDHNSRLVGKTFKLTLPELTNYPDFLVERSRFDASLRREWSPRDHCQVWWASEEDDGGKGGSWWDGRIKQIKAKSKQFPDSPWEMYHVTYKVESSEATAHSPWELFDKEYKIKGCELPSINKSIKEGILDVLHSIDKSSFRKVWCQKSYRCILLGPLVKS